MDEFAGCDGSGGVSSNSKHVSVEYAFGPPTSFGARLNFSWRNLEEKMKENCLDTRHKKMGWCLRFIGRCSTYKLQTNSPPLSHVVSRWSFLQFFGNLRIVDSAEKNKRK